MSAQRNGFTLVELLIVVSIILIITGATIPSLTTYLNNQNIRQAQQQLVSDLRTTQMKALTGSLSDQDVNGAPVAFWGIAFTNGATSYNYFISAIDTSCNSADYTVQGSYSLGNGVNIYNAPNCIFFSLANGDITSTVAWGGVDTTVEVGFTSGAAANREVLFNIAGLVYAFN